jgi:hypothetical protein
LAQYSREKTGIRVAQSHKLREFKDQCVDLVLAAMVLVSVIGLVYQCIPR